MKNVYLVFDERDTLHAVIEAVDGVDRDTVLKNWLGSQGFDPAKPPKCRLSEAPVILWADLEHVFTPYHLRPVRTPHVAVV